MNRRELIKTLGTTAAGVALLSKLNAMGYFASSELTKAAFGDDFLWGVATAAYQIEGAHNADGKGPSVWDTFSHGKKNIKTGETGDVSCDFYHSYAQDIDFIRQMNMQVFRFSTAWSRVLPQGTGAVNQKGLDFYHRVIDTCLEKGVQPWITLYHWDIPQALEDKGGWTNRDVIGWFSEYVDLMSRTYGDKVKNWMVLNEPLAFTALGYLLGIHAPGKKGFKNFIPAAHHTTLCQAEGGRIIRRNVNNANVGTTFSCSAIQPFKPKKVHVKSVVRWDAMVNRLFIEPAVGLGYPIKALPAIKKVEKYMLPNDEDSMKFDFDFIGVQNYTREIVRGNGIIPYMKGLEVPARKRQVETTEMGWEIYPEGIYEVLKKFAAYPNVKKLYVTENGCAFPDAVENGRVHDAKRVQFFKDYLAQVLRAKNEGVNVHGYFVWSLMDNFEWAEGYKTRFGLVHVDFKTQQRILKDSGLWFKELLGD